MKKSRLTITVAIAALFGLSSCNDEKDHNKVGKNTDEPSVHKDKDKDKDHDDHDHSKVIAGPNGGRVLTGVEPHAEFFVTDDRKVRITFVDDDLKPIAATDQSVSVIAGDRSNPTSLTFVKSGTNLVSDKALPEGNDFPVVVQLKTTAGASVVHEKFNLNLLDCPTCEYKEYACTCAHGDE